MKISILSYVILLIVVSMVACDNNRSSSKDDTIMVNRLADVEQPESSVTTLRSALGEVEADQMILFDESLDDGTIALAIVGEDHTF